MSTTVTFFFDEIDCQACAYKLEQSLMKLEKVENVSINLINHKILITTNEVDIFEEVQNVISSVEPDTHIYKTKELFEKACLTSKHNHHDHHHEHEHHHDEIKSNDQYNITYYFDEIDCAGCALKIEEALKKSELINSASINLANHKICISSACDSLFNVVQDIVHSIEPDTRVFETLDDYSNKSIEKISNHHKHYSSKTLINNKLLILIIGILLGAIAIVLDKIIGLDNIIIRIVYIIAYLLIAYKTIIKAFKGFINKDIFNENLLMIIASVGALCINENIEALLVVLLNIIGEYFQKKALGSSSNAISSLSSFKIDKATLSSGEVVDISLIKKDDIIEVKVGERVPLDGIIIEGSTTLDMSMLTGESIPIDAFEKSLVLSGSINLEKVIHIKVTKTKDESTSSIVQKMVEEASLKKSKTENFITKFARVYTPIILLLAIVVFIVEGFILSSMFSIRDALNNTFVFLVASCPCALVISIPLAYFCGIGKCSKYGILVKGSSFIDKMKDVKTICFDKTGTLTKGNFKITNRVIKRNDELFDLLLASIENYTNHPVAKAITSSYSKKLVKLTDVKEEKGKGIIGKYLNEEVIAGKESLIKEYNIEVPVNNSTNTLVHLAYKGEYLGYVELSDEIKDSSYSMIPSIYKRGINSCIISGDKEEAVKSVAKTLKIDSYYAELLPNEKLDTLTSIINSSKKMVAYVGDGINDTPSLKIADVGIAIGARNNDEAIASSDIVLLTDNMNNITRLIDISNYTRKIVYQNIIFSILIKLIVLSLGAFGILSSMGMILGVFSDVGVCLLTVLNTFRIIRKKD